MSVPLSLLPAAPRPLLPGAAVPQAAAINPAQIPFYGIRNLGQTCFFSSALNLIIHEPELRHLLSNNPILAAQNRPLIDFIRDRYDTGVSTPSRDRINKVFQRWVDLNRENRAPLLNGQHSVETTLDTIFSENVRDQESGIVSTIISQLPSGGQEVKSLVFFVLNLNPVIANPTLEECFSWCFQNSQLATAPNCFAFKFNRQDTYFKDPYFLKNDYPNPNYPIDNCIFKQSASRRANLIFTKVKQLLRIDTEVEGYCTSYTSRRKYEILVELPRRPHGPPFSFKILIRNRKAEAPLDSQFDEDKAHFLANFDDYAAQSPALNVLHPLIPRPDGTQFREPLKMTIRATTQILRRADDSTLFPLANDFRFQIASRHVSNNQGAIYEIVSASLHSGNELGGHYTSVHKHPGTGQWYLKDDSTVLRINSAQALDFLRRKGIAYIAHKRENLPPPADDGAPPQM